jgi:Tfp pilus assembly protein PilO
VNRRAPLFVAAGLAVVGILLVVMLVLPKMGEVGDTQDDLTAARDQENALLVQLGVLQDAQAEAPETEREIALIEDQVPPTADLPTLVRLLQAAADRSAVDFFLFSPGTPLADTSGAFSRIQTQITIIGSYFACDEFLFLLETLERASKVTSFTVAPFATGETTTTGIPSDALQMQVAVEFYTTDVSAGPGSVPGATEGAPAAPAVPAGPTGATGATGATGEG